MTLLLSQTNTLSFLSEVFLSLAVVSLPISIALVEIGIYTSLSLWILRKIITRETLLVPRLFKISYLLFIWIALLSLLQVSTANQGVALRGLFKWLSYIMIFLMCQETFQNPAVRQRVIWIFMTSAILLTLNGFYQIWFGADFLRHYSVDVPGRLVRMQSSLRSPNGLAAFYLFALPLAYRFWFEQKTWSFKSAGYLIIFSSFCVAFIMTLSRAAFFALMISVLFYILTHQKKRTLLGMISLLFFLFMLSGDIRHNYLGTLNLRDITIAERLRFWDITWEMIKAKPLFGHGVNTYYQNFPLFAPLSETYRGYAHNCYLQMWSEMGILGVVCFLTPFAVVFYQECTRKPLFRASFELKESLLIGITAYLIQSFFDTNFYSLQVAILFWIFWGMFCALGKSSAAMESV